MRILVTRPEPGASETARRLEELGVEAIVLPLTETRQIGVDLGRLPLAFGAAAVTSANAIRHAPPDLLKRLAAQPCFAVGEITAEAARAAGFEKVVAGAGDAKELAGAIARALPRGSAIAYPCGRVRRPEFETELTLRGYAVVAIEIYDTVEVAPLPAAALRHIGPGELTWALAYSVRGAEALAKLARAEELAQIFAGTRFACLSARIAKPLLGVAGGPSGVAGGRIAVAQRPSEESLLDLVVRG